MQDGFRLRTPFTFTGTLRGFAGDELAFSVGLTGSGLTGSLLGQQQGRPVCRR
jgi:hypothetical protein